MSKRKYGRKQKGRKPYKYRSEDEKAKLIVSYWFRCHSQSRGRLYKDMLTLMALFTVDPMPCGQAYYCGYNRGQTNLSGIKAMRSQTIVTKLTRVDMIPHCVGFASNIEKRHVYVTRMPETETETDGAGDVLAMFGTRYAQIKCESMAAGVGVMEPWRISKIESGWGHCVIVDQSGKVYTMGRNSYGQRGIEEGFGEYEQFDASLKPVECIHWSTQRVVDVQCGWWAIAVTTNEGARPSGLRNLQTILNNKHMTRLFIYLSLVPQVMAWCAWTAVIIAKCTYLEAC